MKTPEYPIDCTGDAVVGDEVCFERATFTGSWRRPQYAGTEVITAKIVKDSYGASKQQHTFTLELANGAKLVLRARNLYREGCHRKPWPNEADREKARVEKHRRGASARAARELRLAEREADWPDKIAGVREA
jgi:hypothetical protein